jgi:hypothetical protein
VLIELNLMESPWAYSVMAVTMLIDAYLLYIFFTVRRPASMPSQTLRVRQTPRDWQHDRIPVRITEPSGDPFGPLNPMFGLLGYVIAIAAIAMLAYVVSQQFGRCHRACSADTNVAAMSASGIKRTFRSLSAMSAFGVKRTCDW